MRDACPNLRAVQIDDVESVLFAVPEEVTEVTVSVIHPGLVHPFHCFGEQSHKISALAYGQCLPDALLEHVFEADAVLEFFGDQKRFRPQRRHTAVPVGNGRHGVHAVTVKMLDRLPLVFGAEHGHSKTQKILEQLSDASAFVVFGVIRAPLHFEAKGLSRLQRTRNGSLQGAHFFKCLLSPLVKRFFQNQFHARGPCNNVFAMWR